MKQSGSQLRHSSVQSARIKQVKFTLLSKQQIERWTVCQVTNPKLYQNKLPTQGGLNDLRMGVNNMMQRCLTCGQNKQCPGHFGRMKLEEPLYHYGYLKFVEKVIKCICTKCSRLRKPKEHDKKKFNTINRMTNGRKKLIALSKLLLGVGKCQRFEVNNGEDIRGCGSSEGCPTKVYVKNSKICVQFPPPKRNKDDPEDEPVKNISDKPIEYTALEIYKILDRIDSTDAAIMGFTDSRPVDMILTQLLICPPQVRPSIEMNAEKRAQDAITSVYNRILMFNNELKKSNSKDDYNTKCKTVAMLEKSVASIMKKTDRVKEGEEGVRLKIKQGSKSIKSFQERLKGKEGRFRQHLMGKRVDFSARSVISPDANLALDELGVPEKVAASLTFPEEVTALNIGRIRKLCEQGKVLYFIKPSQDKKTYDAVDIKNYDYEKELNYGIVVQRCLQDGDFVLFNRQPTLHRMSMMGHRVRILPYNTFRLNLSVCTPYNADFDGDEMNMHVPQSYQSLAEIKHIAHVSKQIITPKNNAPVMGIVQDCLLGIYLFTLRDTFLTREQIMNLIIWIEAQDHRSDLENYLLPGELPIPAILKPVPLWTGKQVMSMVIPKKISSQNFKDKVKDLIYRNIKDVNMIIRKGELITGAMQKETVGSGAGGLIHIIWLEIGPDATNHFITTMQRIVNNWLMQNSFSVGAADIVPTQQCIDKIQAEKEIIEAKYQQLVQKFRNESKMKEQNLHMRGKTIMESLEFHINEHLNAGLGLCQKIVTNCISPYINNIYKMIYVKSKGNETNLCQIIGLLANQNVDGKRAPQSFNKRSLPHFSKYDMSPEPRGFIYNSFFNGLKSHQFFFHSAGGREGLSDTAVKTARTGYIQRKLIKALEDVIVRYDGTVRDSQNNLVQSLYGEDGFAAEFIEKQNLVYDDTIEKFEEKYKWQINQLSHTKITEQGLNILDGEYERLLAARSTFRQVFAKGTTKDVYCPIRIDRLINNMKSKMVNQPMDLIPSDVALDIEKMLDACIHPRFEDEYRELITIERKVNSDINAEDYEGKRLDIAEKKRTFEKESGIELFRAIVRMALSSKMACQHHSLSRCSLRAIIETIKAKFRQSMIHPGEAIGAIAAQCVGEPTTQMTLNTFHSAGIAATNVTLGVPRLQELLDVSKKMKTPSLKIYLKEMPRVATEKIEEKLQKYILYEIPERYLSDYITGTKIFYDYKMDGESLGVHVQSQVEVGINTASITKKLTPWVLAVYFDKDKKIVFSEVWDQVKKAVDEIASKEFDITEISSFNDDKALGIFLRCYDYTYLSDQRRKYESKDKSHYDYYRFLHDFEYRLRKHRLSGVDKIKKVLKSKQKIPIQDEKGEMSEHEYWILQTEGSNLKAMLSYDYVDTTRTVCNDMTEILAVLGIEAARMSFINEFRSVLKHYSIYINYRHLATLADWMTRRGSLTPINRNGINRISDVSVLRKASFEETVEILYDAAVFSQVDGLKGISEKIIFGDHVAIGTGAFPIMLDRVKVKDFVVQRSDDIKDHVRLQTMFTSEQGQNTMSTPNVMGTPWGNWGGGTNINMGTPSRAIGFSPNPYVNQFSQFHHPNFASSRSPGNPYGATTPMVPASMRGQYTPSASSPIYNGYSSPIVSRIHIFNSGMHSPFPGYTVNTNSNASSQSPSYLHGTASPVYSSGLQRVYNNSSRVMQSPRYESPFSNSQHSQSQYGQSSPTYSDERASPGPGKMMDLDIEEENEGEDEDK